MSRTPFDSAAPTEATPWASVFTHHFALESYLERLRESSLLRRRGHDAITLSVTADLELTLVAVAMGARMPVRAGSRPANVLVLEGRVAVAGAGSWTVAGLHHLVSLPARTPHEVQGLEPSALLIIGPRGAGRVRTLAG